jgi:transposase
MTPAPSQVWLVVEPIDMRAGIDGLSQRIQNSLGRSPCDGSAYAFRNRRQNRLKLLIWDGTGVWLCQRRLATPGRPAASRLAGLIHAPERGLFYFQINRTNPVCKRL